MTGFNGSPTPQPRSRAERRERAQATTVETATIAARHERRKSTTGRKVTLWTICGVAVLALGATGWLGYRVLAAKNSLEAAQGLVSTVKDQASTMDFVGIARSAAELSEHTGTAIEQTQDPLWRSAEHIPLIGRNLIAVREMAEVVDSIANDTVTPLAAVAGGLSPESLKPVDGRINIEPIVQLSDAMGPAASAFHEATAKGIAIDVSGTLSPVQDAGAKVSGMLSSADALIGQAATMLQLAPDLLGANGQRHYILMFQNLAEATALGGTSAALTEITVDNGAISIGRQASSADFKWRDGDPILSPDPNTAALFGTVMYERLNLATSRPDFPTAAQIAQAFWQDSVETPVDAVISIDPGALSYLLEATGPLAMSTGDELNNLNAVPLLLNEIYFRYQGDEIPLTDAFFAEAARTVFDALMSPTTNMPQLVSAIARGVQEHRIMAWSPRADQQAALATTPLGGILPASNDDATTTGVFVRDMSGSKMSFYLDMSVELDSDACTTNSPTFITSIELSSRLDPALAPTLPEYVESHFWRGTGMFRTQVFVYGPPGTTLGEGQIVSQGEETRLEQVGSDLGRPVALYSVILAPGESSQIDVKFVGSAGTYGPSEVRTTPMVNTPTVAINELGCVSK